MAIKGIFCIEGGWASKLTSEESVLPLLTFIRGMQGAPYVHRYVDTADALAGLLGKWSQKQYARYSLGYLGFHGSAGQIHLGRRTISLEELAEMIGPRAEGKVLYFGSCGVVKADDEVLDDFMRRTRLRAMCGYEADVDWFESAAFDLLLFDALLHYTRATDAENRLWSRAPDLFENLGFTFRHRSQLT